MTERIESGSKAAADRFREEYDTHLCSDDDRRLKTVAISSEAPDRVLGTDGLSRAEWRQIFEDNGSLQLARNGMTDGTWREAIATVIAALAQLEERTFLGLNEANRLAPQRDGYPDEFDTLATTWHGDGMGVAWVTQRFAKPDEDIVSQCQASMLGRSRIPTTGVAASGLNTPLRRLTRCVQMSRSVEARPTDSNGFKITLRTVAVTNSREPMSSES